MADRDPQPLCGHNLGIVIDDGTMCRWVTRPPSPLCVDDRHAGEWALREALAALQSQAELFAWRYINDARARAAYVRRIAESAVAAAEKRAVFMEVVESSGRSSSRFTSQIPKWSRFGRGLAVVTVAISVYNIWQAKNKLRQGVKEGATLAGGALGGAAATASAGLLCGPGAPVCVTVLFVVGGIAGALIADSAADYVLDQKEVVAWLGE